MPTPSRFISNYAAGTRALSVSRTSLSQVYAPSRRCSHRAAINAMLSGLSEPHPGPPPRRPVDDVGIRMPRMNIDHRSPDKRGRQRAVTGVSHPASHDQPPARVQPWQAAHRLPGSKADQHVRPAGRDQRRRGVPATRTWLTTHPPRCAMPMVSAVRAKYPRPSPPGPDAGGQDRALAAHAAQQQFCSSSPFSSAMHRPGTPARTGRSRCTGGRRSRPCRARPWSAPGSPAPYAAAAAHAFVRVHAHRDRAFLPARCTAPGILAPARLFCGRALDRLNGLLEVERIDA